MLSPRIPNLVPIPGPRKERETPGQRPRPNYGHPQGLLLTAREVAGLDAAGLAAVAGCDVELVEAIESGDLDPCLDTIERLVNAVALECRIGPGADDGLYGDGSDAGEVGRLRGELAAVAAHRASLGLPALAVPEGSQRSWDGTDPAPSRQHGAGDTRCGPGKTAILVRYFRSCAGRLSVSEFAKRCGVAAAELEAIESGELRPGASAVEELLVRAGQGMRARLELYDDHDDGLHLLALADPDFYWGVSVAAAMSARWLVFF